MFVGNIREKLKASHTQITQRKKTPIKNMNNQKFCTTFQSIKKYYIQFTNGRALKILF